jgi:hypothetical protein
MTRALIGRLLVAMSFRDPQGAGDPVELALRCPVLPPADYGPAAAGRVAGPPTDHGELPAGRIAVLAQLGVAPPAADHGPGAAKLCNFAYLCCFRPEWHSVRLQMLAVSRPGAAYVVVCS